MRLRGIGLDHAGQGRLTMRPAAEPYRPELFEHFGTIHARRMFGGLGLFVGDAMVGIVIDELIYLKTDATNRDEFLAEGCAPFTYRKKTGQGVSLSYYRIPERLYDEPEELAQWVRRALAVAEKSPTVQRKRGLLAKSRKRA
ncbi:MAG: TfoX/Sxy family protein [Alphaproteobacteria bacterium]|nr:TfoX/Sxy family protein [Alphaproteobacteria bacterium]